MVKEGIRILGLDDCYINKEVWVVGILYRLNAGVEGVIRFNIEKDGFDSTEAIINHVKRSRFGKTINVIMTNGISFGGFNIFDPKKIFNETGIPIIVISTKRPRFDKIRKALKKLSNWKKRWGLVKKFGEVKEIKIKNSLIYFQHIGIKETDARAIIRKSCVRSKVPEPIRLAHLIASGVSLGESTRKI